MPYKKGQEVRWTWGQGHPQGHIVERYDRVVSKVIKGQLVTRKGSLDNPAYVIEQPNGAYVLKLESEVEAIKDKGEDR